MYKWIILIISMILSVSINAQTISSTPVFALKTTSFSSSQGIPKTYTCEDKNISPDLVWVGVPENTKSFALILSDPDAPGGMVYHWVVYNIPNTVTTIAEGAETIPGTVGKNSRGNMKYDGPCPPKGTTHSYVFTLYALDTLLDLPSGADASALIKATQNHILGTAELTSSYGH